MFPPTPLASRIWTWASTAVDVADAILSAQPPVAGERVTPHLHAEVHRGARPAGREPARRRRRPDVAPAPSACAIPLRAGSSRQVGGGLGAAR